MEIAWGVCRWETTTHRWCGRAIKDTGELELWREGERKNNYGIQTCLGHRTTYEPKEGVRGENPLELCRIFSLGFTEHNEEGVPRSSCGSRKKKETDYRGKCSRVNANTVLMNNMRVVDEIPNSHYTKTYWAWATTETLVRIRNIKEPVVTLIDHGSEINLMSTELYRKGK